MLILTNNVLEILL